MKWGVRKQRERKGSPRGSLTSKISSTAKNVSAAYKKQKRVNALKKVNKARKRQSKIDKRTNNPKKMSEAELKKRIERLELQKKYKDLNSNINQSVLSKGSKIAEDIITSSVKNVGSQLGTYLLGTAVNKALAQVLNDSRVVNPKKGQKDK